ncbi:MAG TPA: hydrolase [Gemmataceae bacterium]|nr:hydrolase [Gemmataceae bacterium]
MPHPTQMAAADTGLLVIDVQDKLMAMIPRAPELIRNIAFLVDAARLLEIPVQATEQYPRGLGSTVAELARRLPERPDKVAFSCCAIPAVAEGFHRAARPKVLLAGIEAHVCVQQTAFDLLTGGFRVYIAADAVASRYPMDHEVALRRLEQAGVILTTAEAAVFEWVGTASAPRFKEISRLVQERMQWLASSQPRTPEPQP